MNLIKCPRCELNYMNDTDKMCSVCRREVRGEGESFIEVEMCSECGENPAISGNDLCIFCLKEMNRRNSASNGSDDTLMAPEDAAIDIESGVSTMTVGCAECDRGMYEHIGIGMPQKTFFIRNINAAEYELSIFDKSVYIVTCSNSKHQ